MKEIDERLMKALKKAVGDNPAEIELLLRYYVGEYISVQGFIRRMLEERLGDQADWILKFIDARTITRVAKLWNRVYTLPTSPAISRTAAFRSSTYSRTQATKTTAESSSTPLIGLWVMSATRLLCRDTSPLRMWFWDPARSARLDLAAVRGCD
ncbi:MAG: hypothetical protein IPK80_28885 [Nannocystis sp.]|nr:hypothetical protein [Nannocystis sp.]